MSPLGSTDGSYLYQDLLLKTSPEYVQVLKKKYMIGQINSKNFPSGLFSCHFSCFPLNMIRKSITGKYFCEKKETECVIIYC